MIERKEIIQCTCDICKKEVESPDDLRTISLPCRTYTPNNFYMYDRTDGLDAITVDACPECREKILTALDTVLDYGYFDYRGYECNLKKGTE